MKFHRDYRLRLSETEDGRFKMTISVGDRLPEATLFRFGPDGPEAVQLSTQLEGRKVALFAVPGAFTPTCSQQHIPGFIQNADAMRAQGVDEIICVSVNDPFVINAWASQTGADRAGIMLLGDPSAEFTKAIGMVFSLAEKGLHDRSLRYSMLVEDGVVKILNKEESPGICTITAGGELLAQLSG